ncbi:Phosphatidylcholine transfer protein [Bagarius yarrelli]|uniref:Phosphatidylcholine transfer protein n=1 Tax=Bagarius yarrelli TaxID=175774 RepID=A0A556V7B1_BAGYA|nr:Phosphatidylcholine transfer protein [Bagarius yarrelli]
MQRGAPLPTMHCRPSVAETGLYEYKVFGTLASCSPEVCADVYMDLDYRKHWDSYVKGKYVYIRERRDLQVNGRKFWVVLARSSLVSQCPEKSGVIRVKEYKHTVVMETDGAQGTKVFMIYFDNPGGNIPTWLINWAAKTGVPGFLKDMQDACAKYPSYCENRK